MCVCVCVCVLCVCVSEFWAQNVHVLYGGGENGAGEGEGGGEAGNPTDRQT
jgi:hypothetical protein